MKRSSKIVVGVVVPASVALLLVVAYLLHRCRARKLWHRSHNGSDDIIRGPNRLRSAVPGPSTRSRQTVCRLGNVDEEMRQSGQHGRDWSHMRTFSPDFNSFEKVGHAKTGKTNGNPARRVPGARRFWRPNIWRLKHASVKGDPDDIDIHSPGGEVKHHRVAELDSRPPDSSRPAIGGTHSNDSPPFPTINKATTRTARPLIPPSILGQLSRIDHFSPAPPRRRGATAATRESRPARPQQPSPELRGVRKLEVVMRRRDVRWRSQSQVTQPEVPQSRGADSDAVVSSKAELSIGLDIAGFTPKTAPSSPISDTYIGASAMEPEDAADYNGRKIFQMDDNMPCPEELHGEILPHEDALMIRGSLCNDVQPMSSALPFHSSSEDDMLSVQPSKSPDIPSGWNQTNSSSAQRCSFVSQNGRNLITPVIVKESPYAVRDPVEYPRTATSGDALFWRDMDTSNMDFAMTPTTTAHGDLEYSWKQMLESINLGWDVKDMEEEEKTSDRRVRSPSQGPGLGAWLDDIVPLENHFTQAPLPLTSPYHVQPGQDLNQSPWGSLEDAELYEAREKLKKVIRKEPSTESDDWASFQLHSEYCRAKSPFMEQSLNQMHEMSSSTTPRGSESVAALSSSKTPGTRSSIRETETPSDDALQNQKDLGQRRIKLGASEFFVDQNEENERGGELIMPSASYEPCSISTNYDLSGLPWGGISVRSFTEAGKREPEADDYTRRKSEYLAAIPQHSLTSYTGMLAEDETVTRTEIESVPLEKRPNVQTRFGQPLNAVSPAAGRELDTTVDPWDPEFKPNPVMFAHLHVDGKEVARNEGAKTSKEHHLGTMVKIPGGQCSALLRGEERPAASLHHDTPSMYCIESTREISTEASSSPASQDTFATTATPSSSTSSPQAIAVPGATENTCSHCGLTFSTAGSRNKHVNRKHVRRFICSVADCTSAFHLGADLKRHQINVHKAVHSNVKTWKCTKQGCSNPDVVFKRKDNYMRHLDRCNGYYR